MAFGIGTNTEGTNAGTMKRVQRNVACLTWFTANGTMYPKILKLEDEDGMITTVKDIRTNSVEEKNYSGIPSLEYDCIIVLHGFEIPIKLVYFKEACKWVIREL